MINSETVKFDKDRQWKNAMKTVTPELTEENSGGQGSTSKSPHTVTRSELQEDTIVQVVMLPP